MELVAAQTSNTATFYDFMGWQLFLVAGIVIFALILGSFKRQKTKRFNAFKKHLHQSIEDPTLRN